MLPPLARTLPDLLRENAGLRGEQVAVIAGDRQATYSALHARAQAVAAGLRGLGIGHGDRVGMIVSNRVEWLEICFGATLAGAVAVPFSTWSTAKELAFLLVDSKVKVLFTLASFGENDFVAALRANAPEGLRIFLVGEGEGFDPFAAFGAEPDGEQLAPGEGAGAGDDALILYTSGSTSAPKGVRMKHHGIIENGFNIGERQGLTADDRVFLSAPLFWSYGSANALSATFTHGATLVLQEKFEPAGALDLIERHRCTSVYTLPAMTNAMVRTPEFRRERTASLRTGLTIGGSQDVLAAVETLGVPEICNIYGATETYGNCCVTHHDWPIERKLASQGLPLPGQELRFRDEETGEIVASGQPGLVEVRGYVTPGYTGVSSELNAEAFTEDGFYKTGDIGRLDENGGFVFIGRSTEMIKRAGINVSPAEIEEVLLQHPAVVRTAVVGVPDARRGEAIVAYVVPADHGAARVDALVAHCADALSKYKIPDHFEFIDALPLTPTGKLMRKELKQAAIAAYSQAMPAGRAS
ncbi:MAG: acyl--CoA ligase [Rhodobiaceae bacterium]|nr:acyl--CoA ligase [Rhodobiaceae bacterium]MCC0056250.1 acyl--CoA ligase [Rhodobiaceae bacterium]